MPRAHGQRARPEPARAADRGARSACRDRPRHPRRLRQPGGRPARRRSGARSAIGDRARVLAARSAGSPGHSRARRGRPARRAAPRRRPRAQAAGSGPPRVRARDRARPGRCPGPTPARLGEGRPTGSASCPSRRSGTRLPLRSSRRRNGGRGAPRACARTVGWGGARSAASVRGDVSARDRSIRLLGAALDGIVGLALGSAGSDLFGRADGGALLARPPDRGRPDDLRPAAPRVSEGSAAGDLRVDVVVPAAGSSQRMAAPTRCAPRSAAGRCSRGRSRPWLGARRGADRRRRRAPSVSPEILDAPWLPSAVAAVVEGGATATGVGRQRHPGPPIARGRTGPRGPRP